MNTTPDCQSTVLALPWLLNGSLPQDERRQVREHLIGCPSCREELARTREMLAMVRTAGEAEAAPQPVTRFAAGRRPALLRVAWAAALVAVLASTVGIWRANHSRSTVAAATASPAAAAVRPAPSAASAPAHDVVSVMNFESPSARPEFTIAASKPEPEATAARRPVREMRAAGAPHSARPTSISSMSFENGNLGESL